MYQQIHFQNQVLCDCRRHCSTVAGVIRGCRLLQPIGRIPLNPLPKGSTQYLFSPRLTQNDTDRATFFISESLVKVCGNNKAVDLGTLAGLVGFDTYNFTGGCYEQR